MPLYTFRCDDVYGGNNMARQNHVRHIPCLILKDDKGNELARTECAHMPETLHQSFDAALKGGETKKLESPAQTRQEQPKPERTLAKRPRKPARKPRQQ